MILWTTQDEYVYQMIMKSGVYRCEFQYSFISDSPMAYDWLVAQMTKRISPPPAGVTYPVWAWHTWEGARRKTDLRRERWQYGPRGDRYYCMEIEILDKEVLLSDYDTWHMVLNNWFITNTREEDEEYDRLEEQLPPEALQLLKEKNWEGVFDLTPVNNDWTRRGDSIQATFWELRKDQVRDVRMFTAANKITSCANNAVRLAKKAALQEPDPFTPGMLEQLIRQIEVRAQEESKV